jgi:hypothetical protein
MAIYTVIQTVDQPAFRVAIVGSDGVRQTILGFATQADAEAWISRDKWQSAAERYLIPPEPTDEPLAAGPIVGGFRREIDRRVRMQRVRPKRMWHSRR